MTRLGAAGRQGASAVSGEDGGSEKPSVRADLLRVPLLGRFLAWKHARSTLQVLLLAAAVLVVLDGFWGPALAPKNMAGVLPWVHWRGLVALSLLLVGNLFCMACPFMLPRRLAKRILPASRHWPRALRSKWLAIGLLFLFLWAYEAFDLWASPFLTAWLTLAYFLAAFLIDGFFRGAAFCKYVCPIGHFNFVNSLASPSEVAIRDPGVCAACRTRDCIVGRFEQPRGTPRGERALRTGERGRLLQRGCELWLYQEGKIGNMDCTFCLECVLACPYDNVGILLRAPGRELWDDRRRAGVGQLSRRPDLSALAVFLTFAALVNALGMVSPGVALQERLSAALGTGSDAWVVLFLFLTGTLVLPAVLLSLTAFFSTRANRSERSIAEEATVYGYSLVPLGLGIWAGHYLFHFLTGALAIVPLTQEYLAGYGLPLLGTPAWALGPVVPEAVLPAIEIGVLEVGLLLSLGVSYRIARREAGAEGSVWRTALPWWILLAALSVAGAWVLSQPMEMRGTLGLG